MNSMAAKKTNKAEAFKVVEPKTRDTSPVFSKARPVTDQKLLDKIKSHVPRQGTFSKQLNSIVIGGATEMVGAEFKRVKSLVFAFNSKKDNKKRFSTVEVDGRVFVTDES